MGEYQNPTYRGINDPSVGTRAFHSSFATWFDKIFGAMMNAQKMAQAQQAQLAKQRQDWAKKYGDFRGNLYNKVIPNAHKGLTSAINLAVPKIATVAKIQGWGEDKLKDVEASFGNQITHLNSLADSLAGNNAIKWDEVDMSIEGAHELKAIMGNLSTLSDTEIQEIFGIDFAVDPTNLPEGVGLHSIYSKDLINPINGEAVNSDTWSQWIENVKAGEKTGSGNSQEKTIASAVKLIETDQKNRASSLYDALNLDPNMNYDIVNKDHLLETRNDLNNLIDDWDGEGGVNHYIWANEGDKISDFEEGYEVIWNGKRVKLSEEMANMMNSLNYGDVQRAITFHENKGSVLDKKLGINPETYEQDNVSEVGFTLESADFDMADFVLTAQKSKIADYLMEHKVQTLNVKQRKPVTIKESKKSVYEIKSDNQSTLYNNYENDLSELMEVYTDPDRYTVDDIKVPSTGQNLTTWLMNRSIKRGGENRDILGATLDNGILTIKVKAGMQQGTIQTKSWTYDLTADNYSGFYELIGAITGSLDDKQVLNENQRYDRIK